MDPNVLQTKFLETAQEWLFNPLVGKVVFLVLALLVMQVLARFVLGFLSAHITENDNRYRARKLVTFIKYGLIVFIVATIFSDRLGGFTVAFGVAGAGIAFALQEVIASVAGWLAVSFGGFFKTGDRIQLGGIRGDVIDISILRTTIMELGEWINGDLYSGRVVRVANSFVFKEPVYNYSGDFPFLWDEITIPITHGSDVKLARRILEKASDAIVGSYANEASVAWRELVKKYRIENATVEPLVTMVFNDNWIEFTIRYVTDYKKRRSTKNLLFSLILEELEKTNGQVAVASATFQLVKPSTLNVKMLNPTDT